MESAGTITDSVDLSVECCHCNCVRHLSSQVGDLVANLKIHAETDEQHYCYRRPVEPNLRLFLVQKTTTTEPEYFQSECLEFGTGSQ